MNSFSHIRAAFVFACISAGLLGLTGRVAWLQTMGRQKIIARAERQQHRTEILTARRGCIYDANGYLMAGTVQTRALFADPKFMQDQYQLEGRSLLKLDEDVEKLAKLIDRDPFELSQLLGERYESRFIRLADNLDESTVKAINSLDIPGIGTNPVNQRFYPMGSIASHILGGMRKDGVGLEGLEVKFEDELKGRDGYKRTLKDARRREIAVAAEDYLPPLHGEHLVLTIDANIQLIAEQELAATCAQFRAPRGEVLVLDPQTGAILAMANWPSFNPQNIEDSTQDIRRNRVLVDPYEPGSTIKPFIVGPALYWGLTRPAEVLHTGGSSYKSSLRAKRVTDVHGYDALSVWDVLVKSSNIGMTILGERLGAVKVRSALGLFNFGHPTGIELPGEDPGLLRPAARWSNSDVVSSVQGYSIMVTPMQLARAFCVYANGGRLVQPHLIKGILDDGGNCIDRPLAAARSDRPILNPEAAMTVRRILCDVPVRGTGTKAFSRTWNIFGKTGTAHISQAGGYAEKYHSSFICGAPFENPRIVVAMVIHEPDRKLAHFGGTVSAPGGGRIVERTLSYLQVPASPELPPPPPSIGTVLHNFNPDIYHQLRTRKSPS